MKKQNLLLWSFCIITGLALLTSFNSAGQNQSDQPKNQTADEYFNLLRNNQVTGMVDPQDELLARTKVNDLVRLKSSNALNLNWSEVGPDNLGGRTRAIIFDVNNPQTVYAASVTGGVWKSVSGGSSWNKMSVNGNNDEVINVTCLTQGSNGVIYAGTGEYFENRYTPNGTISGTGYGLGGIIGKGLFKSTDGQNFTLINSTQPSVLNSTTADWAYINELGVGSTGRLFACTNKGLRYSDDGGDSWTFAKSNGSDLTELAADIKIGSSGIIVAVVGNKCYISPNGDPNSFTNVSIGGAGNIPLPSLVSRIEAAIAPANNNILYLMVAKTNGALLNIYRSVNQGQSWTVVGPGGSSAFNVFNASTDLTSGQGLYSNTITVMPDNPDIILVGGVNMWRGVKIDDGYFAWEQTCDAGYSSYYSLYVHANHHCYTFHPSDPERFLIGTDGGIFQSLDAALSFTNLNRNYNVTAVNRLSVSHDDKVLAGSIGGGSFIITRQGNTPKQAEQFTSANGGGCAVSFINPKAMFISYPNCAVRRTINSGANFDAFYSSAMSTISGAYITPIAFWENFNFQQSIDSVMYICYDTIMPNQSITVKSNNGDYPFIVVNNTGTILWPKDTVYFKDLVQSKLFVGANGAIWYTRGAVNVKTSLTPKWFKLCNFTMTVNTLAVTPDGNTLFAGTQNGYLLRLNGIVEYNDDGVNDLEVDTIANWPSRVITSIAINDKNTDEVLVTLGNYGNTDYVYATDDAMSAAPTFVTRQGNLPSMPVYSSLVELNGSGRILIGTEMGVFSTETISATTPTWTAESTGMGNLPVYDLKQQKVNWYPIVMSPDTLVVNNYGGIYAATNGRGIFECKQYVGFDDPNTNPAALNSSAIMVFPNPVNSLATITYDLKSSGNVTFELYDMTGRLLDQIQCERKTSGKHIFNLPVDQLPAGAYMLKMTSEDTIETAKFIKQ